MKFRHAMSLIAPTAHDHPRNASVIATLSNIFILEMILDHFGRGVVWTAQCVASDGEPQGPDVLNPKDQV